MPVEPLSSAVRLARRVGPRVALILLLAVHGRPAIAQSVSDIDTADASTLAATLPGIGPVKALRIVEYRELHGPFGNLDRLIEVKGIGPVTLERIRTHLGAGAIAGPRPSEAALRAPKPLAGHGDGAGAGGAREDEEGTATVDRALSTSEAEELARAAVRTIVVRARREEAMSLGAKGVDAGQ